MLASLCFDIYLRIWYWEGFLGNLPSKRALRTRRYSGFNYVLRGLRAIENPGYHREVEWTSFIPMARVFGAQQKVRADAIHGAFGGTASVWDDPVKLAMIGGGLILVLMFGLWIWRLKSKRR